METYGMGNKPCVYCWGADLKRNNWNLPLSVIVFFFLDLRSLGLDFFPCLFGKFKIFSTPSPHKLNVWRQVWARAAQESSLRSRPERDKAVSLCEQGCAPNSINGNGSGRDRDTQGLAAGYFCRGKNTRRAIWLELRTDLEVWRGRTPNAGNEKGCVQSQNFAGMVTHFYVIWSEE